MISFLCDIIVKVVVSTYILDFFFFKLYIYHYHDSYCPWCKQACTLSSGFNNRPKTTIQTTEN